MIEVQEFLEALIGVVDEYEHCMTRSQQAELLGMITSSVFAEARTSEPGFSEDMPFPAFAAHIINKNTRVRELSDVRGGGR